MRIVAKVGLTILSVPFYLFACAGWSMMVTALFGLFDPNLHKYTQIVPMIFAIAVVGHIGIAVINAIQSRIDKALAKPRI